MARLGKYTVRVKAEGTQDERNFRDVDFVINVNSEGLFTTTLDENLVSELDQAGIFFVHQRTAWRPQGLLSIKYKGWLVQANIGCI